MSGNNNHSIDQQLKRDDIDSSVSAALDGGYGWVIVAAAFILNCISDGIAFSCGILFVEFKNVFEDTHGRTAFAGAIFTGVPMICGPFCGILIELFDCRAVVMVGSLISAFGFILSIFAPSVDFLCFSLGIVAGVGFSMVYVPAMVIVSRYFDTKRALATGISASGSGVGTFIFPILIQYLIDHFALQGTLLLLAGIICNCCVSAALFRPIESYWESILDDTSKRKHSTVVASPAELLPMMTSAQDINHTEPQGNQSSVLHAGFSLLNLPTMSGRRWTSGADEAQPPKRASLHHLRSHLRTIDRHAVVLHRQRNPNQWPDYLQPHKPHPRPPLRFFTSCPELTVRNQSNEATTSIQVLPAKEEEEEEEEETKSDKKCCPRVFRKAYARRRSFLLILFNKQLWSDWKFILFFVSNIILYAWYDVPYLYLPDYMHQYGLGNSQWVIGVLGVINTIGQVVVGLVGDLQQVNIVLLYLVCMLMTGIANVLLPHLTSAVGVIVYVSVFGFFISANYALCSVILVNLFGLGYLTTAYGMILFGQGFANSFFPPIGGFLRDSTGSYVSAFYLSGISIAISGLILLPIIVWRKPHVQATPDPVPL